MEEGFRRCVVWPEQRRLLVARSCCGTVLVKESNAMETAGHYHDEDEAERGGVLCLAKRKARCSRANNVAAARHIPGVIA